MHFLSIWQLRMLPAGSSFPVLRFAAHCPTKHLEESFATARSVAFVETPSIKEVSAQSESQGPEDWVRAELPKR